MIIMILTNIFVFQEITKSQDSASNLSLRDRSFDLVLLCDWEDQIIYHPGSLPPSLTTMPDAHTEHSSNLANPTNAALEAGEWTKSIIWDSKAPFRNFTQLELHETEDTTAEYSSNNNQGAASLLTLHAYI